MGDLIDRRAAIDAIAFGITYAKAFDKETGKVKELFAEGNYELKKAIDRIKELPSAEPEIVRCKDCKYYNPIGVCIEMSSAVCEDSFCCWAERRTDG